MSKNKINKNVFIFKNQIHKNQIINKQRQKQKIKLLPAQDTRTILRTIKNKQIISYQLAILIKYIFLHIIYSRQKMNSSSMQDNPSFNFSKQQALLSTTYSRPSSFNPQSQSQNSYQHLIYQNKIQILQDRLKCYQQQVQNLKKTNNILLNKIASINQIQQELQSQQHRNIQLKEQISIYRERIQQCSQEYEQKMKSLQQQIEGKEKFVQLIKEENQKIINKKDEQINYLRQALKQKIARLEQYEKKFHNMEIQRLNSEQDYDNFTTERQRDSVYTRKSHSSKYHSQNSQNINSLNHNQTLSVQQKAKQFMKKDPHQLKIMMKSLSNAQKCLQIGGQQISMIVTDREKQKSFLGASNMLAKSKINKTYYK